ncbi:uncharacterized protein EV420DRAFT_1584372, partial [Desarmillaria tabescens]
GQGEIKKLIKTLLGRGTAKDVKGLTISFSTAEYQEKSKRGEQIAELLKQQVFPSPRVVSLLNVVFWTPNLTTLTLNFSGHLDTYSDCLGEKLIVALCSLKNVENFSHHATTSARTDFGQYSLMKLVLSWPNLRTVIIIISELSNAPGFHSIDLNGDTDTGGTTRKAFAEALNRDDSFPALRWLSYPGERGTYKTGRGRNVHVHEYESVRTKELEEAARKKGVRTELAWRDLEYKVEGSQRRAGFAAMSRRGYW